MSELSPEARALLRDGQGILRPSASDRARIALSLSSRLGAASLLMTSPALAVAKKSAVSLKLSLTAASAGIVVAGATYFWSEPAKVDVARPPATVQRQVAEVAPPPAPPNEVEHPEVIPPAVLPAPTAPAKVTPADRLGEEVNILSRAMTVLRSGNAGEALRLLDAHRQQFPSGRLVEERRAARVQALCALGRRSEAEAELSRLERSAPRSPHVARAKRACGLN